MAENIDSPYMCEKIFRTLLVGEWASYYTALRLGVDPTPVDLVERFKAELKRQRKVLAQTGMN